MNMTLIFIALLLPLHVRQSAVSAITVRTVCEVVRHPDLYEGKVVYVESFVLASQHGVVLVGDQCKNGIYLSHEAGKTGGKWPEFDQALARKSTGLDTRPLWVKVKGVYRSKYHTAKRLIRQLEVLEVLDVSIRND
jgi:hypothetical protein